MPMLFQVEAGDIERRPCDHEIRRQAREIQGERMRHRCHQIRARDDHGQAQEMRREQNDLARNLLALQNPLEDFLAAAFGAHDGMFHREKRFERQALRS